MADPVPPQPPGMPPLSNYTTGNSPVTGSPSGYPATSLDPNKGKTDTGETAAPDDTSTGSGDNSEVMTFDIAHLPFRFNPPLHKQSRFLITDLSEGAGFPTKHNAKFYNDTHNQYDAKFAVREDAKKTGFENLRLGRIIMDDMAVSRGVLESGKRYGFRFLYNPSEIGGTLNVGTNFIPDQRSTASAVLQKGLENLQFEVLINRIPDVTSKIKVSDYEPTISEYDREQIVEQGTHYDLDFLYRCANGFHNTSSRKNTGDIGVLLPNPCRLILGPYTTRGALVQVSVSDQMFSDNMVPILSYVTITFARFLNMAQKDMDLLESYGVSREGGEGGEEEEDGGDSGNVDEGPSGPGGAPNTGKGPNYPINFSGVKGTSEYGHRVHSAVTDAFNWTDRSGGFGTYGGNGNHGQGRALDIMLAKDPKNSSNRGWEVARFLKNKASNLFVTQVIFQKKIWTTDRFQEGWRSMGDRGNDTDNHYDHVHVSFGPGSGNDDFSKKLTLTTSQQYWK